MIIKSTFTMLLKSESDYKDAGDKCDSVVGPPGDTLCLRFFARRGVRQLLRLEFIQNPVYERR